jgi:solute carrier family 35 protein E3
MEGGKQGSGGRSGQSSVLRGILSVLQWWGFNVLVIIMNKWIFQKLDFKFPLTVSTVHFICSTIGAHIAIKVLQLKPLIEVNPADRWSRILPMSFIFCLNIVLGNVSLRYIPVSFMQTIKSFTPATTGALASSPSPSPIFSSVLQFTKVWLISAIQNNTGLSM